MNRTAGRPVGRLIVGIFVVFIAFQGVSAADKPLRVSLFPYVPDGALIRNVIKTRWDALNTGVDLDLTTYSQWDCYSTDPPADLDVFETDSIMLDYFVHNNNAATLSPEAVSASEDFFDFAWTGSMVDGRLYGVPRLLCTNVLFCRKGDAEIEAATSLYDIYKRLGNSSDAADCPQANKGMLIDMKGGTTCACLYLNAEEDLAGAYQLFPQLPRADALDAKGTGNVVLLLKMAGRKQALHVDPPVPDRAAWFSQGFGRVYAGYSERLYFMDPASHANVRVRSLPLAKKTVNLFFVDMLCINTTVRGKRRDLAMKLIDLCTSADVAKACLMPSNGKPSQYLLPARESLYTDAQLIAAAPLYSDLLAIVKTNPGTFRLGPDGRRWLTTEKPLIQAILFRP
jgi:thiamine pyridinylase